MRFGIICGRSWIGQALISTMSQRDRIARTGQTITVYPKDFPYDCDEQWMDLQALFLIAGRTRPDEVEKSRERDLIQRVIMTAPYGLRVIYLSSSEVTRDTDYGRHKLACETQIRSSLKGQDWVCTRPPAVYGPGQPLESEMLIPSLARTDGDVDILTPGIYREYVHVDDLINRLIELGTFGTALSSLPTLRATPEQLKRLYNTWKSYRQLRSL